MSIWMSLTLSTLQTEAWSWTTTCFSTEGVWIAFFVTRTHELLPTGWVGRAWRPSRRLLQGGAPACAGGKSSGEVADYEAKLKAALKEHKGGMSMATLGSAVKRPAAVPKLKKFLEGHAAFKLDEKGNVSLR